jgi:hypothetical protein
MKNDEDEEKQRYQKQRKKKNEARINKRIHTQQSSML